MHIPIMNENPSNYEHLRTNDQPLPPFLVCMFRGFIFPNVSHIGFQLTGAILIRQ